VQVAVHDRGQRRGWKLFCLLEEPGDERRRAPDPEPLELGEIATRQRHPLRHVGARVCVHRQRLIQLDGVKRPQEARELQHHLEPGRVVELCVAGLAAGEELAAEERPWVALGGVPAEDRVRDRQRQERCELRQDRQFELYAGNRDLPPREAKGIPLVHDPDGVVPALGQRAQRVHAQLRELRQEQTGKRLAHDDLRAPDWHRPRLASALANAWKATPVTTAGGSRLHFRRCTEGMLGEQYPPDALRRADPVVPS
jgi:hypothetical protein